MLILLWQGYWLCDNRRAATLAVFNVAWRMVCIVRYASISRPVEGHLPRFKRLARVQPGLERSESLGEHPHVRPQRRVRDVPSWSSGAGTLGPGCCRSIACAWMRWQFAAQESACLLLQVMHVCSQAHGRRLRSQRQAVSVHFAASAAQHPDVKNTHSAARGREGVIHRSHTFLLRRILP